MKSLLEFTEKFNTEESCYDHFRNSVGTDCRNCGNEKTYIYSDGKTYKCSSCKKKFTLKKGTIFENSPIPLKKWYFAIFLLDYSKKGMSSVELSEKLGVTQKTAWFMYHRIRETYQQDLNKFNGTVEVDETFVGGKEKNKHSWQRKGELPKKAVVIGAINRDTKQVKVSHIKDTKEMSIEVLNAWYCYYRLKYSLESNPTLEDKIYSIMKTERLLNNDIKELKNRTSDLLVLGGKK